MPLLSITNGGSPGVLRLEGEIDLATASQLREALEAAITSGEPVVLDMASVTFIDSSGLHAVVETASGMDGGRPLVLQNVSPRVARLFEIVGVGEFPAIEIRQEAPAG